MFDTNMNLHHKDTSNKRPKTTIITTISQNNCLINVKIFRYLINLCNPWNLSCHSSNIIVTLLLLLLLFAINLGVTILSLQLLSVVKMWLLVFSLFSLSKEECHYLIVKGEEVRYQSVKAIWCQRACLFVCLFPIFSETADLSELKFWEMIPLVSQIVLG